MTALIFKLIGGIGLFLMGKQTASGKGDPAQALEVLDEMRWLDRVGYHTWRIGNYLGGDGKPEKSPLDARTHFDE